MTTVTALSPALASTAPEGTWVKVIEQQNKVLTVDLGATIVNNLFRNNGGSTPIFRWDVAGATDCVYKRLTSAANWDCYSNMKTTWSSANNTMGTDFNLFSTVSAALSNSSPWTVCNYDDTGVAFPRDCGPSGTRGMNFFTVDFARWGNWNPPPKGNDSAFYVLIPTSAPLPAELAPTTTTVAPAVTVQGSAPVFQMGQATTAFAEEGALAKCQQDVCTTVLNTINTQTAAIASLKAQIADLQNQIDKANNDKTAADNAKALAQTIVAAQQTASDAAAKKAADASTALASTNTQLADSQNKYNDAVNKFNSLACQSGWRAAF